MRSVKNVGRIIGLVMMVRLLAAPFIYFVLMLPVTEPNFLARAAGSTLQIRVAVLLTFVLGALSLAIPIAAMPVFRRYSERMALSFLALSAIGIATLATENVAILSMVSLSQAYTKAGAANELLQALGGSARSAWRWAHFINLALAHVAAFMLSGILYRFALVPRALAAVALAAGLVAIIAVTMPLLGYRFMFLLVMPTAVGQLALTLWLLVRGFEEQQSLLRGEAE